MKAIKAEHNAGPSRWLPAPAARWVASATLAAACVAAEADSPSLAFRRRRPAQAGPSACVPDTRVGTFTQALYDEAKKSGWFVVSMKDDWKRIFAFEP